MRTWAPEILMELGPGPRRFNGLLNGIEGISDRLLHQRLQDLCDARLVDRQVIAGPPIQVRYGLTVAGRKYLTPLEELAAVDAQVDPREVAIG